MAPRPTQAAICFTGTTLLENVVLRPTDSSHPLVYFPPAGRGSAEGFVRCGNCGFGLSYMRQCRKNSKKKRSLC